MKELLDRYIRGLAEREHSRSAPERLQDLGTFLEWLLERLEFTVHMHAFKRDGLDRTKNSGRLQLGVDILASKRDDDGVDRLFRFVLKTGPVGTREFGAPEPGTIIHDVHLAAGRDVERDALDHVDLSHTFERVTIVVVHNGSFDSEAAGPLRSQLKKSLFDRYRVDLDWWDAERLVILASGSHVDGLTPFASPADASLFPTGVRPLVRGVLDSVRRNDGEESRLGALSRYLDYAFPTGDERPDLPTLTLLRLGNELPLFVEMVIVESRARIDGSTLMALDTIERVLCRYTEQIRLCRDLGSYSRALRRVLEVLLRQYVEIAVILLGRLDTISTIKFSLARMDHGEPIDYRLRALRLIGYLATAGLVALDLDDTATAEHFSRTITALCESNEAGCCDPITDDQQIELICVWELANATGRSDAPRNIAAAVLSRGIARMRTSRPLPALYVRARVPMRSNEVRDLVAANLFDEPIEDSGSILYALACCIAVRTQAAAFLQAVHEMSAQRSLFLQIWCARDDAPDEWYTRDASAHGVVQVLSTTLTGAPLDVGQLRADVRGRMTAVQSLASEWRFPSIDRIAWKCFRTRPPLSSLEAVFERETFDQA